MAASLPQIMAEMQAYLSVRFPAVTFLTGEKALEGNGVLPQITWIPVQSTFGPPEKRSNNPRSLWTRIARLVVHIWAEDFEQIDAIEVAVIQVAHAVAWGSYGLEGSDPSDDAHLTQGQTTRLTLTFNIPIPDAAWLTVVPTNFAVLPGATGDGILENGES